jgi:hypothetical protein
MMRCNPLVNLYEEQEVCLAKAEIFAGGCGFSTTVEATMNGKTCALVITSDCESIRRLAQELTQVQPLQEISARRATPETLQKGIAHCAHAACPVPVGIIKAVEVEAKLALPADVIIKLSR